MSRERARDANWQIWMTLHQYVPDSKIQHRVSKELEPLIVPHIRVCLLVHEGAVADRFGKDPAFLKSIFELLFQP